MLLVVQTSVSGRTLSGSKEFSDLPKLHRRRQPDHWKQIVEGSEKLKNPSLKEVSTGLVITSFYTIISMYVGGQFFGWDITRNIPIWLGLAVYFQIGIVMAAIGSIVATALWFFLRWWEAKVVWWVPGLLLACPLGAFMAQSGSLTYTVFGVLVGAFGGLLFWRTAVGNQREVHLAFKKHQKRPSA